jgi:tetratricopeptide (TPR) repeat protein
VRLDTALGIYRGILPEAADAGFWWRAGPEAGFRFTPSLMLSADFGFRQYLGRGGAVLNQGIYTGIALHLTLEAGGRSNGVDLRMIQEDPVYPVFFPLYRENRIGFLLITNRENAEIRNLRVSFRAGDYSSSEINCGSIALIGRGMRGELPLYADFSPAILNFTENGRISGELVISYTLLDRRREIVRGVSVQVYNRNFYPLDIAGDLAGLAAFVSPNSPEVMEFSRYIVGIARTNRRTGLNTPMQSGIWLFESLRALNIAQRDNPSLTDVQFPAQTLAYRSGSTLDIALLYGALLESSGIRAGIIPVEGDYLAAIDLGIYRDDPVTASLFYGEDRLLIVGDEVWLPLAVSKLGNGFAEAWAEGIRRINSITAEGGAEFVILEDAWAAYPPAPLPPLGVRLNRPDEAQVSAGVTAALTRYVANEFDPKIRDLTRQIAAGSSATQYNQLGNLYLRAGRTAQAKTAYAEAIRLGSAGAMVNRANLALRERDFTGAGRWFRQALATDPGNPALDSIRASAQRGLDQIALRQEN